MAGYTHTCASCDAKLKVHERYVGRALHCPTCGTEFLADPSLADIDDLIADLVPDRKRSIPWLPILGGALLLSALIVVLGTADDESFLAELFRPSRSAGQFAELVLEGRDRVPVALDHETIVFVVHALEDEDAGSLQALHTQGRIIEIVAGTKIKIIEQKRRDRIARVRILAGVWTGRVVWVPLAAIR